MTNLVDTEGGSLSYSPSSAAHRNDALGKDMLGLYTFFPKFNFL